MKRIKLIIFTLLVCMSFAGVAEAKSRGGSFKSGFASQKRAAAKPAATYNKPAQEQKKTAFGSFGGADAKNQQAAANMPQSKMSSDLTGSRAQSNALRAADARNKPSENLTGNSKETPNGNESGWFRSGSQYTTPTSTTANQSLKNNSQRFEPRNNAQHNSGAQSNGLLYGLMGFMLGNSLAQHGNASNVQPVTETQANEQNASPENNQAILRGENVELNSINTEGVVAQRTQDVSAGETESLFMKIVRVLLWLAIISGVIWVVRNVLGFRHRHHKKSTYYSLGS